MTRTTTFASLALICGLLLGCGDRDRDRTPPPPASSQGIVGQLTGDPDDEVDPALQQLVAEALQRGDQDAPLEF